MLLPPLQSRLGFRVALGQENVGTTDALSLSRMADDHALQGRACRSSCQRVSTCAKHACVQRKCQGSLQLCMFGNDRSQGDVDSIFADDGALRTVLWHNSACLASGHWQR